MVVVHELSAPVCPKHRNGTIVNDFDTRWEPRKRTTYERAAIAISRTVKQAEESDRTNHLQGLTFFPVVKSSHLTFFAAVARGLWKVSFVKIL